MGLKNKWSRRDEKELETLLARKTAFTMEAREPLNKLAAEMNLSLRDGPIPTAPSLAYPSLVVDRLIANADALRDALAPFDSGVRCGSGG